MPIRLVQGDLFANRFGAQALAQGCNCQGSMGAGIAVGFKERYPAMYEEYRKRCKAKPREFNPGDVFLWREAGGPAVFNLATQEDYWRSRATYDRVEQCLNAMRELADTEAITSIAMPRVGAGYGGLSWKKVKTVLESAFGDWSGVLYVYEDFVPEESASLAG
jgi:O-acetyl-ADP-ribose deacetylase (regulator of RNase III)